MDGTPQKEISLSDQLRASAVNDVANEYKNLAKTDPISFIQECHKKFCQKKIEQFPYMCEIARMQNFLKWQDIKKNDKSRGKFTETYGWSEDGTFKFDYDIPEELYNFMQNLVYNEFWDDSNRPIWRRFMKRVCDGDDPTQLLIWVRSQYGVNQGKVTSHGM